VDDDTFWSLIARIDRRALQDGDEDAALQPLRGGLEALSVEGLRGFQDVLAAKLYQLDTRAHASSAGDAGESSDGFLYVRCFVVACGRTHFERVRSDPSLMPTSLDEWLEPLLNVAEEVYEQRTSERWPFTTAVSVETGSNTDGWR
jgi:hypothetical protein